jgi:pimeloyl-ACP methyl ester carboxylesterase
VFAAANNVAGGISALLAAAVPALSAAALPAGWQSLRIPGHGIGLHAVTAGPEDGRLVVLLHGFPEFWYGWRHQIGPLAEAGLRIVVPDQRGYNLSDKPAQIAAYRLDALADDMLGLADALGTERFSVVGHDWGAVVAWHLASRDPGRIERAAILNGPHPASYLPFLSRHPKQAMKSYYVGLFQFPWLPELALSAGHFFVLKNTMVRSGRSGTFAAADWPHYRAAWRQPGALSAMLNWYRARARDFAGLRPRRVGVPVRIIWGERDAFLESGLVAESAALCDNAEIFRLKDATHWVQHDAPDEVNRLLREFLA